MSRSRGMIQVSGVSYRIDRVGRGYEIVRLLDDITIGSFQDNPRWAVVCDGDVDEHSLRAIALAAVRQGRTVWKPASATNRFVFRRLNRMAQQLALLITFPRSATRPNG